MLISTIINDAYLEINAISAIDEAAPQDHALALRKLNRIVGLYNTQHLLISFIQDIKFIMPSGGWTSPIRIGPGLQFPGVAPTHIETAFFREGDNDYDLKMMTANQWASIGVKNVKGIPGRYYEQNLDQSRSKIYFDCIPQDGLSLHLLCKLPMNAGIAFKSTDDITFSHGMEKLLVERLALELCGPNMASQLEVQMLAGKVQEGEDNIKAFNYEPRVQKSSKTLRSRNTRRR